MNEDAVEAGSDVIENATMGLASRLTYRSLRLVVRGLAKGWLRLSVAGTENLPKSGGYVLAPGGHRSILDTPIVAIVGPRLLRFMGAENYFRIPFLGWFLEAVGGFAIERSATDRAAMRLAEEVLNNGEPLVVFPEGTRQSGPVIQELKHGAAFLACRAGVPLVPVGLGGAERAWPKSARLIRPSKVAVVVGKPIYPPKRVEGERVKRSAVQEVSTELSERLQALFDEAQIERNEHFAGSYMSVV